MTIATGHVNKKPRKRTKSTGKISLEIFRAGDGKAMRRIRKFFIASDDLLKVAVVFVIGVFLGFLSSTYSLTEKKKLDDDRIMQDFPVELGQVEGSTNLALNIPIVRIGSGIR